jgi:hypothetical protein
MENAAMQSVLVAIAILSAAVAVTMAGIVFRMLRAERRRSDARVAALLDMTADLAIDPAAPAAGTGQRITPTPSVAPDEAGPPVPSHPRSEVLFADVRELVDVRSVEFDEEPLTVRDFVDPPEADTPPVRGLGSLFAERETVSPWGRRLAIAAACATLVTVAGVAFGSWDRTGRPEESVAEQSTGAPLELLSLRHSADGNGFTITGLVQNPRNGTMIMGVTAVALLFGRDGSLMASSRAPLDFTQLRPGTESPFVVQVADARGVARYRISFRNGDGAMLAHVDRRGVGPLAQND